MFEKYLENYRMNRFLLFVPLLVVSINMLSAQRGDTKWSLLLGGQASYGFASAPETRAESATDFLSGYSAAYGLGLVSCLRYRVTSSVCISAALGIDAHRFSYELISPPTFGEVQGRTVPGRYLTKFKGVGASSFFETGVEITVGSSNWSPALILKGGIRDWVIEQSNADKAYLAGYQSSESRADSRHQGYVGAGFGVSPLGSSNQISLLYQRTFDRYQPIHQAFVLRQIFQLGRQHRGVTCPTF